MKKLFQIFLAASILLSSLITPTKAFADGMIMPPGPYPIYESGQKAAIFYQDGTEHMVLSIQFYGDKLAEFGWVVPVPTEPEVEKGDIAIFRELGDMTVPKENLLEKLMSDDNYYATPMMDGAGAMEDSTNQKTTVEVIEEKQVGILDVATLRAEKVQDLIDWMDENGYVFPSTDGLGNSDLKTKQVLQDYIDEDWYFILSKVNPEFVDEEVSSETIYDEPYYDDYYYYRPEQKVDLTPLRISFKTTDIVYPMKISAGGLRNQSVLLYVFDNHKLRVSNYDYEQNYGYREDEDDNSRFVTEYSEKIDKSDIDDLTSSIGKGSWLEPDSDMYLTKLYCSSLAYTDMDEDVLFEDAKDNKSVNAGEMTVWEWILLPIVFVVYLPYNILNGFEGFMDYTYWGGGIVSAIVLIGFMIALSAAIVFGFAWGTKKMKTDLAKKILKVLLFPALWLLGIFVALVAVIPFGYIMELVGVRSDVIMIDAVMLEGLLSTGLVLLGYRIIGRKNL